MKKLQNNFTTPEQSKHLLELGVPADSADMWWEKDETTQINGEWVHCAAWSITPSLISWDREKNRYYTYSEVKEAIENLTGYETLPCWSAGRLIEIYNMCANFMPGMQLGLDYEPENCTYIEMIISCFELAADNGLLNFSELEE